jgi:glycosyltransferase involved in cell wall biosynthesis
LAVIEAKLAGVPIVSARYPGVECVVRDGTDGFVFGLDDTAKAAEHVIGLLDDPESRLRLSRAGREFAVDQHSRPEIMAGEFATVYETLAGAYRRRGGSRARSAIIAGDG